MSDIIASEIEEYDISHDSWQLPKSDVDREQELLELQSRLSVYCWDHGIKNEDEYKKRLEYEFDVIYNNGFLPYFKAVGKICAFVDNDLKSRNEEFD